eukprot:1776826-Rhodomonas_salina.1
MVTMMVTMMMMMMMMITTTMMMMMMMMMVVVVVVVMMMMGLLAGVLASGIWFSLRCARTCQISYLISECKYLPDFAVVELDTALLAHCHCSVCKAFVPAARPSTSGRRGSCDRSHRREREKERTSCGETESLQAVQVWAGQAWRGNEGAGTMRRRGRTRAVSRTRLPSCRCQRARSSA